MEPSTVGVRLRKDFGPTTQQARATPAAAYLRGCLEQQDRREDELSSLRRAVEHAATCPSPDHRHGRPDANRRRNSHVLVGGPHRPPASRCSGVR